MRVNLNIIYSQTIKKLFYIGIELEIFVSTISFMSIGNSINTTAFNDFVEDKLYQRKQKIIEEKNLSNQILQKFAKMFKSSLRVSSNL